MGAEDLGTSDVSTLVDATHVGDNRNILLTMRPTSPGIADAMNIIDCLRNPKCGKPDAKRRAFGPFRRGMGDV